MQEQSKSLARRSKDLAFVDRWMSGHGIDIGAGSDVLSPCPELPKITKVDYWDLPQGDAQTMTGVPDDKYDFVHSSHCLEHVRNPAAALSNWLRITKPGGFIIVTVPDELLYEQGKWPSIFNADHKNSFTTRYSPVIPSSINVAHLCWVVSCEIEKIQLISDGWDPLKVGEDQSLGKAECSIEFVLRKMQQ